MIRDAQKEDTKTLEAIHETTGFDYRFPDLEDPLFIVKKVSDEDGVHQGIALKVEATVYLWLDPNWGTAEERWERFVELTDEAKKAAWQKGLDTLTCVIPPELEKSFGKRLEQIGMVRDRPWPKFSFDLNEYIPRS